MRARKGRGASPPGRARDARRPSAAQWTGISLTEVASVTQTWVPSKATPPGALIPNGPPESVRTQEPSLVFSSVTELPP